jgi:hypothetical protein
MNAIAAGVAADLTLFPLLRAALHAMLMTPRYAPVSGFPDSEKRERPASDRGRQVSASQMGCSGHWLSGIKQVEPLQKRCSVIH